MYLSRSEPETKKKNLTVNSPSQMQMFMSKWMFDWRTAISHSAIAFTTTTIAQMIIIY